MSFSVFANDEKQSDIPEVVVYGANLQTNILERKEKLKDDMVITPEEMKVIFASYYKLDVQKLEDYEFIEKE